MFSTRGEKRWKPSDSMDEEGTPMIDSATIKETVMTRLNEAMRHSLSELNIPKSSSPGNQPQTQTDTNAILNAILPPLVTSVVHAVTECLEKFLDVMSKREEERCDSARGEALSAQVRSLTYQNDKLEQYTRRENVRINGVPEEVGESADSSEKKALAVLRETGAVVNDFDLAACHRVGGKPRSGPRGIIVRFVSRRKRTEVMKGKKNLKGKPDFLNIYINDDLTVLRAKLLGYVKSLPDIDRVWTIEGKIFALKKSPPGVTPPARPRPYVIESPDGLFDLELDSVDYEKLGLRHLSFGQTSR